VVANDNTTMFTKCCPHKSFPNIEHVTSTAQDKIQYIRWEEMHVKRCLIYT
jgi:hypothetical protein